MRITTVSYLKAAMKEYPRAEEALNQWIARVNQARWQNPVEMKRDFPTVDPATVKRKRPVYVFNLRRNEFRLIAAIHFNTQRVFTLRFLTHAEYSLDQWKEEL